MIFRCEKCGSPNNLDGRALKQVQRDVLHIYAELDREWARLVREYLDLFRSPSGTLADRKHLRLLQELTGWMRAGTFSYYGRPYPITAPDILRGVQIVCNAEIRGLRDHNYLRKVLVSICERRDGDAETKEEYGRMQGRGRETPPAGGGASTQGISLQGGTEDGGGDGPSADRLAPEELREMINRALPGFGRRCDESDRG